MSLYKIHHHKTKLVLCFILFQFYQKCFTIFQLPVVALLQCLDSNKTIAKIPQRKLNSFSVSSELSSLSLNVITYSDSVSTDLYSAWQWRGVKAKQRSASASISCIKNQFHLLREGSTCSPMQLCCTVHINTITCQSPVRG